jgi:hypothetical protein
MIVTEVTTLLRLKLSQMFQLVTVLLVTGFQDAPSVSGGALGAF